MYPNLDRIVHNYEVSADCLPLYTVGAAVSQKFMPYAVQAEVVEELVTMAHPSADKPEAPVYMLLKPNIASEGVKVGCFFVSEEEVFVLPDQYSAVLLLIL